WTRLSLPARTARRSPTPASSSPFSTGSRSSLARRRWSATPSKTTSKAHARSACRQCCWTAKAAARPSRSASSRCASCRLLWVYPSPPSRQPSDHRTRLVRLTDRSIAPEEKRRLILEAAVRVFARKGYHTCRVGDIAEEAGVAYGLVYHYFSSKEEILETIFRETWCELLEAVREVEESGESAGEQLRQVAALLLRAWRRDPELVRVLVREIARSPELQRQVGEIGQAFAAIE